MQPYSQADFDKNLPAWRTKLEAGAIAADALIAMVSTKGALSEAMKQAIRAVKKAAPADVTDVQPKNEAPAPQPEPAGVEDDDGMPWKD